MDKVQSGVLQFNSSFRDEPYPAGFLEAYDLLECLAHGHGTETFLVSERQSGSLFVAKCYDKLVYAALHEDEILLKLHHDGFPACAASFENTRYGVTVRSYVEGTPLDRYAGENRLSERQVCRICIQLCDILSYLHGQKRPVIHRDIKPQNIIVKQDGSLVLIDFDIARQYSEDAETDTQFFGTRIYAPPEQYGFAQTDCRTDLYALGVLLRFLLTGSEKEDQGRAISRRMKRVVDRCAAFSPKDRFVSAAAVKKALLRSGAEWRRKMILSVGLAAGAFSMLCAGFALGRYTAFLLPKGNPDLAVFREPLIEAAARVQLGKAEGEPITMKELSAVRELHIFGTVVAKTREPFENGLAGGGSATRGGIVTLEDLSMMPNIEELQISYQELEDISGLAALKGLISVDLMHTRVSDISALSGKQSLLSVNLYGTNVQDATCLDFCARLDYLELGETLVTSLDEIGGANTLKSLSLIGLHMDTLDGIGRFCALEKLWLTNATANSLDACLELPALQTVYASGELCRQMKELFAGSGVTVVEG